MNLDDYITLFLSYLKSLNRSEETLNQYRKELQYFIKFLKEKEIDDIKNVDTIHIDLYQAHLIDKGNTSTTRSKKASVLRQFFKYMNSRNYIVSSPTDALDPIKTKDADKKRKHVLSIDEAVRFINSITKHSVYKDKNKCIAMVFLFCGVRVSELCALRVEDVEFKNNTLHIRNGKGGKDRETFLPKQVAKELKHYLKNRPVDSEFLFNKKLTKEPLKPRSVHDLIKRHIKKARIKKNIGCHDLRKSSATNYLLGGVNVRNIQIFLGHSDISTTMRYLNPDKEEVKADFKSKDLLSKKLNKASKKSHNR